MPPKKRIRNSDEDHFEVSEDSDNLSKKKTKSKKQNQQKTVSEYSHWLIKSEPESRIENGVDVKFSIEDLKKCPDQTSCWDGVRNYQARNFMRDQMKIGHEAFFYHSNCKTPGIIGIVKVVKEGYPDHTQFDNKELHYDRASKPEDPRWYMVDVKFVRMLKRFISLAELKEIHLTHKTNKGPLANMALFTRSRLSVQPLTKDEWNFILELENEE